MFAVCGNQIKTFDLVLYYLSKFPEALDKKPRPEELKKPPIQGPRSLFYWDENGNNALHFAVMHNLQGMYTHILKTAKHVVRAEFKSALREKMETGDKNHDIVVKLEELRSKEQEVVWETVWKQSKQSGETSKSMEQREDKNNYSKGLDEVIAEVVRNRLVVALNKDMHSKSPIKPLVSQNSPSLNPPSNYM